MSPPTHASFELGSWRVEPLLHQLVRGEDARSAIPSITKHITPKTMEVLLVLADHAGQVVTRDNLLEAAWPQAHVREEVITRTISDLRSALEDDRRAPKCIETIPKVGYRLIARVNRPRVAGSNGVHRVDELPEISDRELSLDAPAPGRSSARGWGLVLTTAVLAAAVFVGFGMRLSRERVQPAVGGTLPTTAPFAASPLTSFPGFESFAEVAPDGRHVAFSRYGDGDEDQGGHDGASGNIDIYVLASGGGEPLRLTQDPAQDAGATWSPDGLRLAFGRYRSSDSEEEERCTLIEAPAGGGPERRLGSCGNNGTADFAWSPSGEWIAYSERREGDKTFGIYLLSTLTGESHLLVAPDEAHWGDRDPQFSPDGSQVAFTRSVSMNTQDVFRVPVTGGEPVPITRDQRSIRGHAWLPDGSALVVSSGRTGSRGLWRFPLAGGPPSWLPIAVDHAWNPTLGRAAGPLLFEYRVLEAGLRERALKSTAEPVAWLESTREDLDPQVSPDGSRIAFTSNRSGHFEIWSASMSGGDPVQLTAMNGAFTGAPRWSPDSRSIVFDARLDGQADVFRVVPGDTPERLTNHPANDLGPSYSADGHWIYFGSNRAGEWQIWRRPAGGGDSQQVTADGGYQGLVSATGDSLFVTRFGQDGLFRVSLGSGAPLPVSGGEPIPETESLPGHDHWTVVGDTLYWLARSDNRVTLERLRPGGDPERVVDLGSVDLMPGLSITAEESSMVYTELTRLESDLWRVEAETLLSNGSALVR